jgi:PKD repeat protein
VAFTPDQAPVASFTVTAAAAGSPTSFNSSASTTAYGTITNYAWNFGDGDNANTSTATTTHTYASWGNYTATVTLTDSAGTSTTQVFTGPTVSDNGGTSAEAHQSVTVPSVLGWVTTPGNISFSDTLSGDDQTATATLPLDVGDGNLTAGWSLSATSTTFSTSGGAHVLSTAATTVQSAPTGSCDSTCTLATNAITYPYTLPGGSTAPTATNL